MNIIPEGFFRSAENPTDEEIIRWAFIEGAHYPPEVEQDWDLFVADPRRANLLVRLAADGKCPNRTFFLDCLYLLVGDAVRTKGGTWPLEEAAQWLSQQSADWPKEVTDFLQRARELLARPEMFDYNKWCDHGYAYGIDDAATNATQKPARRWWQFFK